MVNRINKRQARKAFNEGKEVLVFPCNLRPDWFGVIIKRKRLDDDFDKIINQFEFYNCLNKETGKYAGYII